MAYTTINKSSDYFNTKLYDGTGSVANVTGVGFQPDFTWIKRRNDTRSNFVTDAVRGAGKQLKTNLTGTQTTYTGYLNAFLSDGFTLGTDGDSNATGGTYASWNWKAGTTSGIATNGATTITPGSYSFNQTSGMSIINYDGNNTAGAKVAHGLGATPDMMIVKAMNGGSIHWAVYHKDMGNTHYMQFDTNAKLDDAGVWNDTSPDNVNFTVGNSDKTNTVTYIAYCFADVQGYSKFGSYVGNGSSDGTFVYTGMKPSFVMMKNASQSGKWLMMDSKRPTAAPGNPNNARLFADVSNAESTNSNMIDMLSNGFKVRTSDTDHNASGDTNIYMAFAEVPLVGTNNVPATAR
jgi:hypothetical protein